MTSTDDASKAVGWHTIDWVKANQTVKRLQIRIVKAIQAKVVKPVSKKT